MYIYIYIFLVYQLCVVSCRIYHGQRENVDKTVAWRCQLTQLPTARWFNGTAANEKRTSTFLFILHFPPLVVERWGLEKEKRKTNGSSSYCGALYSISPMNCRRKLALFLMLPYLLVCLALFTRSPSLLLSLGILWDAPRFFKWLFKNKIISPYSCMYIYIHIYTHAFLCVKSWGLIWHSPADLFLGFI